MKQIKSLDLNALEKRIVKTTETKEALRDVTPFTLDHSTNQTKLIVDKDTKNV